MTDQPERRMMRPKHSIRPGDATVAADMCPRCKGDNTEAFSLCGTCAAPAALRDRYAAALHGVARRLNGSDDFGYAPGNETIWQEQADAVLAVRDTELEQLRTELERVRAALDSFDGRGVLGSPNCWPIPTASEVLDAIRAALESEEQS